MKLINYIFVAIISTSVVGCFSLDQNPYDEIGVENTFKSFYDLEAWRTGVYSKMREQIQGNNMYLTDIQSDILNATHNATDASKDFHRWETLNASNKEIQDIWRGVYSAISNINTIIGGINNVPTSTDKQKEELVYYTGEMYLARAYYYSYLATLFCKPYDESTAKNEFGLPMPIQYDINARHKRSTLQQTYDQILSDIDKAKALLKGKTDATRTSFTEDAAIALKARVLLYMKKWSEAYQEANSLLSKGEYSLVTTEDALKKIWVEDDTSESIMQFVTNTKEAFSADDFIYSRAVSFGPGVFLNVAQYIPSQWVVDLYDAQDFRKAIYFNKVYLASGINAYPNIYIVNKYPGNPKLQTGSTSNNAHAPKVFRLAEIYLIAAEAAYHSGNDALTPLNALKTARGLTSSTLSGTALYEEIQNERLREMAFEGTRLFDLRRWGKEVKRQTPQNINAVIPTPAEQFVDLLKSANDNKSVWGIPSRDLNLVDKSEQNPGW